MTETAVAKPSKSELKRQQIFADRMRRHMAGGLTQEQAAAKIQKEDYERLPVDQKLRMLEGIVFGNFQKVFEHIEGMKRDMRTMADTLKGNQESLADVMDVNFQAYDACLVKLGLSSEDQQKIVEEVEERIKADRAAEAAKKTLAEEQTKKEELAAKVDQAGTPPEPPAEATVFGG